MSSPDHPAGADQPGSAYPTTPYGPGDAGSALSPWAAVTPPVAPGAPGAPITPGDPEYAASRYVWRSEIEPPTPPDPPGRSQAAVASAVVVVIAVLGFAVGWLWYHVAPRIEIIKVDGGYAYANAEPEQAIAADGWFLIIGIGLGLVLGIAAWLLLRRFRGVGMLIALAVGSILGSWAAWWLGYRLARADFTAAAAKSVLGQHLSAPLELGISNMDPHRMWFPGFTGVMVGQALAAVLIYTALAGFSAYDNLRPPRPPQAEAETPAPATSAPPG